MLQLVLAFLVIWVVLAVIGLIVHGLFWLFVIGLVLFFVTGGFGARARRRS